MKKVLLGILLGFGCFFAVYCSSKVQGTGCTGNSQCTNQATPICSKGSCIAKCTENTNCASPTPNCNANTGECIAQCTQSSDCGSTQTPVCINGACAPKCTQDLACAQVPQTPYCNASSGECVAVTRVCNGVPVWFMADNQQKAYLAGEAPFGTNPDTDPTTYASLDQECRNQAAKLGADLKYMNWKAVVLLPDTSGKFSQEAVSRNNFFWSNLVNIRNNLAAASDPVQCIQSQLVQSSNGSVVPNQHVTDGSIIWFGVNSDGATTTTDLSNTNICNGFTSIAPTQAQITNMLFIGTGSETMGLNAMNSTTDNWCVHPNYILCAAQF